MAQFSVKIMRLTGSVLGENQQVLAELQPIAGPAPSGSRGPRQGDKRDTPLRDTDGLVTDGRDNWLSTIAFHAVHDALDRGDPLDAETIAATVWQRFVDTTDIGRPKQDGRQCYGARDALKKVLDKLKLLSSGNLRDRHRATVEPEYAAPSLPVEAARIELDRVLGCAMNAIGDWHLEGRLMEAPRMGIRATVGLGKSTAARRHIARLMAGLAEQAQPHRVLNFVPSLALADETAAAWAKLGQRVAVLRGYEALHLTTREPMCRDLAAVRSAVEAGQDIQSSVCHRNQKQRCPHFVTCPKQANRRDVQEAQVVVAAYDTMFTGFAGDKQDFAMIVVDEACWSRSIEETAGLTIEALPFLGIEAVAASRRQDAKGADLADVVAARHKLQVALAALPSGEVRAEDLTALQIDAVFCADAAKTEFNALPANGLVPGQRPSERKAALAQNIRRGLGLRVLGLWDALATLLRGDATAVAKVWLEAPRAPDGQRAIRIWRHKAVAAELSNLPILHLDATLRPEIATSVLPGLEVATIEAAAPNQHVRLIAGRFGLGSLCPAPHLDPGEANRRANHLRECVDYVRWHALRHASGRCLVITYKGIEPAFAGIPGVEVAHYNAVAGLDGWSDIACLFLIGRPLPSSVELRELTGAILNQSVDGKYGSVQVGILTENGRKSSVQAIRHENPAAEILRAAICDDEVMQALGRGRGINRTEHNPLEVHILADVVLPIGYDRVVTWETVCPDIVQRMLLAGLAVDSPADAAALHPELFSGVEQAKKAFQRALFGGHSPIGISYREMSLKSAAYRRPGRGHGWQRAGWIEGSSTEVLRKLEAALGPLAEWIVEDLG